MAIKVNDKDLIILKGKTPIRAVMLGNTCIHGENMKMYTVDYPATPTGVGYYIEINGNRMVSDPSESGRLGVADGANLKVRIYGLQNYMNPLSAIVSGDNEIAGEPFSIQLSEEVSIERATIYSFVACSNIVLNISEAEVAPKVRIPIVKDAGVDNVNWEYYQSPYIEVFSENKSFTGNILESYSGTSDYFEVYAGSQIADIKRSATYFEGYKADTIEASYYGYVNRDDQSIINVTSKKGKIVSLFCPALPEGVKSYAIKMRRSEYSRVCPYNSIIYNGSTQSNTLSTREYEGQSYYLYEEDIIEITAERTQGFKKPTLGKDGDISELVSTKSITLLDDTALIIRAGERGYAINLSNQPLSTGEYVLLDVKSDFGDQQLQKRNPIIYRGDKISIPLDPKHRIGTYTYRKPGVGLSDGNEQLCSVTFTQALEYTVSNNISQLIVTLQQGDRRVLTSAYAPQPVLSVEDEGTYSSTNYGQGGRPSKISPVQDRGPESFYIHSLNVVYYTKRYLGDGIGSKFIKNEIENLPTPFSGSCTSNLGVTYNGVLTGSYVISADRSYIKVTIDKYNRNWVANTLHKVEFYAKEITI